MHRRAEVRRLHACAREARLEQSRIPGAPPPGAAGVDPQLLEALAALSRPLREVLLLHAWGELSNDEIAAAMALSPAAVRTRLHRARAKVAARIRLAEGVSESDLRSEAGG